MENVYSTKRFISLIVLILVVFAIFITRFANWQIKDSNYYKMCAASYRSYIMKTDPIRGEILDRNGIPLATNSVGYKLVMDDFNIPDGQQCDLICKVLNLLDYLNISWNDTLPIKLDKKNNFIFDEENQNGIKDLKKYLKNVKSDDAKDYIDSLSKKIKCDSLPNKLLRDVCSVYYSTRSNTVVSNNIDEKSMCVISEFNFPGFRVETFSRRYYPYGFSAAHILGYTGLMSSEEYEKYKEKNYSLDSTVGKTGIEYAFEDNLRGFGGKRAVQFSKEGTVTDVAELLEAKPGDSIFLTIDHNIQQAAELALEESINSAVKKGAKGCKAGSAVALNIKTGEILAAASFPSFDLEKYNVDKSYYHELVSDSTLPLLNRAFCGIYPPGSTFKPLIALSALQDNLLDGLDETIHCGGSYNHYSGYRLHCTGHHGDSNLLRALARSCNVFFAELGRRLGAQRIAYYADQFGIKDKTGIILPESSGTIGNLENDFNYKSAASQAAIGQGEVTVSALQLAKIPAVIGGKKNIQPCIVKQVTDHLQKNIIKTFDFSEKKLDISEQNFKYVQEAMREVVLTGLATDFKDYPVAVAAKTGTAQTHSGADHTTFICYAPFDDPQIAVSVIVENGIYGNISKYVARKILDSYFGF